MEKQNVIQFGKEVLVKESEAIRLVSERLGSDFYEAFEAIYQCKGKVILTGLGKPGRICQKIASTLSSTGTPSFYLHPSEALHGDFGMIDKEDCILAISNGGETRELIAVVKFAREMDLPVIAVTGNLRSTLAQKASCVIDSGVSMEADTLGLAPTSSSTVALALGDALAVVTMKAKGMTKERFAQLHPGGSLGRDLTLVENLMRPSSEICTVHRNSQFQDIVGTMNRSNYGIAAVVDEFGHLEGCITDGDLRRILIKYGVSSFEKNTEELMLLSEPKTIDPCRKAVDAVSIMEEHKITVLFVTANTKLLGIIRMHDLLAAKIL